jgi:glutathione S-transferase
MKLTLVLGTRNWSSWSLRPWLVLKASGLAFTEEIVRLRHDNEEASVKARSPSGLVPLLEVGEGPARYAVWDSLAIAEFVAELAPQAGLWPEDRSLRALARSSCAEMHSGFGELRRQYSMEFARILDPSPPTQGTEAAIIRIRTIWRDLLARAGGPFLTGARFGIADAFYAPVVSRFRTYGVQFDGPEAAWASMLWAHPFMAEWLRGAEAEIAAGWCG